MSPRTGVHNVPGTLPTRAQPGEEEGEDGEWEKDKKEEEEGEERGTGEEGGALASTGAP